MRRASAEAWSTPPAVWERVYQWRARALKATLNLGLYHDAHERLKAQLVEVRRERDELKLLVAAGKPPGDARPISRPVPGPVTQQPQRR